MTLTEFLLERITEDEIHAGILWAGRRDMHWQWSTHGYSGPPTVEIAGTGQEHPPMVAQVQLEHAHEHIARWDPARVLAECEAKRQAVELHRRCGSGHGYCDDGGHGWDDGGCADLAYLALPFASHPDYDEAWKPEPS